MAILSDYVFQSKPQRAISAAERHPVDGKTHKTGLFNLVLWVQEYAIRATRRDENQMSHNRQKRGGTFAAGNLTNPPNGGDLAVIAFEATGERLDCSVGMPLNGYRMRNAMNDIKPVILAIPFLALLMAGRFVGEEPEFRDLPAWVDEVQTYLMCPVLPKRAEAFNATVNGVWGGMGGIDPILNTSEPGPAVQRVFGTDSRKFAAACHQKGLIVVGTVNSLEGVMALKEKWPDLENMACRDAMGRPSMNGKRTDFLTCTNNPDWLKWQIDYGKEAIDLGADLVLVDTPMSSAFLAGFLGGGFCKPCMAKFKKYMDGHFSADDRKRKFDLVGFDEQEIIQKLAQFQFMAKPRRDAFTETAPEALLYREFIHCQEEASFETKKQLFDAMRQYAGRKNRKVAFTTNAADMSTSNAGNHWIRGLMFADLVDLFVYEQNVLPDGRMTPVATRLPRGKWAAYHKLSYSIFNRRSAAVFHANAMVTLIKQVPEELKAINTWNGVLSAEAYAANGAFVQYYIEPVEWLSVFRTRYWLKSIEHAGFVQGRKALYEGRLKSGSPLAVLFLHNERGRTIPAVCPSYLGFAQALTEGNFAFDVLFGGDGRYIKDRLTAEMLQGYRTILVPSPIEPTDNQKALLQEFVKAGGTLVCQEPDQLGFSYDEESIQEEPLDSLSGSLAFGKGLIQILAGDVTLTWTNDVGANYFKTYDARFRDGILKLAASWGITPVLERPADGLVSAFPVLQEEAKRVVLHLVNYDVDYKHDAIREKTDVRITVPRPDFATGPLSCSIHTPGERGISHPKLTASDTHISFILPRLGISASAVIAASTAK